MRNEYSPMIGRATNDEIAKLRAYAVRNAGRMRQEMTQGLPDRAGKLVEYYDMLCKRAGLDTVLVVCQTWHETGAWSSTWFDAPRRNPAGIGVNGRTSPIWLPGYQKLPSGKYGKGKAYETYAIATMAHVWGLCRWVGVDVEKLKVPDRYHGQMYNPPKKALGTVNQVRQLGWEHNPAKIGWAHPGSSYGYAIAKLANYVVV